MPACAVHPQDSPLAEVLPTLGWDVRTGAGILVADGQRFENPEEFASFLADASRHRPVLGVVASGETALLTALADRPGLGIVDLCRRTDFTAQVGARLALLSCRARPIDPLTGLGLRSALTPRLAEVCAAPGPRPTAFFVLDLDHFKHVNDTWGHAMGDAVLRHVGALVRSFEGLEDAVFRIGGDEFCGIVEAADRPAVADLLDRLRDRIASTPLHAEGRELVVTVSIGFVFLEPGQDPDQVRRRADEGLYAAKATGRNRVQCQDLCWDAVGADPNHAAMEHFENVTRVWTERLSDLIRSVGRRAMEESRRSAEHDGLTDLFNRRYFDRRVARDIENARRNGTPLSLVVLDVDHFHVVNMEYGYPTGDAALKAVADLAQNHSRVTDWVARYGGEEFVVVLPGTGPDAAILVAERMRAALEAMVVTGFEDRRLRITASLGVASLAEVSTSANPAVALVQVAGDRVVAAKNAGRNRVVGP